MKTPARKKTARAMALPQVTEKIMKRSYQRSGEVAGGTLLASGARQATIALPPKVFRQVKFAADDAGVSFSEMIRQCVSAYMPE